MNSIQYEELCRLFLARELEVPIDEIRSGELPAAIRPSEPSYRNKVDLYWVTETRVAQYVNIVNAKWRGSATVNQEAVQLLQTVRSDIGAQKALLLTNTGFTEGARAAAAKHGIGLHVVRPAFETSDLPKKSRDAIRSAIQQQAQDSSAPPYTYHVIRKAAPGARRQPSAAGSSGRVSGAPTTQSKRTPRSSTTKLGGGVTRSGTPGRSGPDGTKGGGLRK